MNGSVGATIFYVISYLVLFSGFFFYKKTEKTQYGMTWLALTGVMSECYVAFVGGVINLVHIPVNAVTLGILNLALGIFFWYRIRRTKEKQSYKFNGYDIAFAVLLVGVVLLYAQKRYGLVELNWNYRTVDPAARYREAMEFVNNQSISRMFFAQIQNGMLIELLSPWKKYDYYYQIYVLGDILQLILSGAMFYGVVRKWCKDRFISVAAIVASFFYLLGYPLNSTLYGFTYLGMSLYLVAMLIVLTDMFMEDEMNKWFTVILLMLGCHAIFQCYVLFMPVTFLAIGLAFLLKQHRKKILFSLDTLKTGLAIFVLPCVLGLYYTYMDVFVNDNVTVESAISAEGAIYRDLYSNFLFFIPVAVFGYILLIKNKKNRFLAWFAPMFAVFTLGMFAIGYETRKVSTYYFFKDYYMLWLVVFVLLVYALAHMKKDGRLMTCLYMCSWAFVAMMFLTQLESRIEQKNNLYVVDNKAQRYNDLLCFNWNTMFVEHFSDEKMDLMHFVYSNLLDGGVTEDQVPAACSQEESYLYESVTGQRLSDFEFWRDADHYDDYFENIDNNTEYICVFADSQLYADNQEYYDSMYRVYENSAGFVAMVHESSY